MQGFQILPIYRAKNRIINLKKIEDMKKLLLFAALFIGLCSSCSNNDTPEMPETPTPPPSQWIELDKRTQEEMASTGNDFAHNLMQQMNKQIPNENMMISPMSLQFALGMLSNGADEEALKEITDVMGMEDYSLMMMNSFYFNLTQQMKKKDKNFTLNIANSIWIQENYQVEEAFIENNQDFFDAQVTNINFSQADKAKQTINQWASDATQGTIKELCCNITNLTRVVLANACYLKGKWTIPFKKKDTKKETFHNQDGTTSQIDMMHLTQTFNFRGSKEESYMAVELPYGDQTFSMLVVLPNEDKTLKEILPDIPWNRMYLGGKKVNVELPKFKIEANYPDEIKESVKAMGIHRIFNEGSLPGINEQLLVNQITQDTFIDVNEAGTEASAVTTITTDLGSAGNNVTTSPTPTIRMDRPFAFAIRENTTGTILFMGKVVQM